MRLLLYASNLPRIPPYLILPDMNRLSTLESRIDFELAFDESGVPRHNCRMADMTMRERMLAIFRNEKLDRIPFVQYDGMIDTEEVYAVVPRENLGRARWTTVYDRVHPNCRFESAESVERGIRTVCSKLSTPKGELRQLAQIEPTYGAQSIKEHYIKSLDDYEIFFSYLDDIEVVANPEPYERAIEELGDDGLPHTSVGRTPYQQLWIQWINIADLSTHLLEARGLVEEAMAKIGAIVIEAARLSLQFEPPYLVIPDNITAPMIGEHNFRLYCEPYYNDISDLMATKGIPVVVHTDGDLKPLWRAISDSKISGLDSFSPYPDNDTRVSEAVELWPDKVLMVNFPSSVHISPPEEIYRAAMGILEDAGHTGRLQLQISENVPPGIYKTSYPEIVRAIDDFGDPFV